MSHGTVCVCSALDYWEQAATARLSALDNHLATFDPRTPSTVLLRPVDEEISALKKVLSSLFVRRTRLSLVSHIPPELLARIFSFIASNEPPMVDSRQKLGWIKVSHVCSWWRRVALDTPLLWATINLDLGPQWALSMVERARRVPLVVQHTQIRTVKDSNMVIDFLSSHLPVITKLKLVVPNNALAEVMVKALSEPILSSEYAPSTRSGTVDRKAMLSDALVNYNIPCLQAVTIVGCRVPWSSSIWHNMAHLKISITPEQWMQFLHRAWLPSEDEFFDMLASMCHLESLSISNYFPRSFSMSASGGMRQPALAFNHLSNLELRGQYEHCVVVLGNIRFRATAVVSLDCRGGYDDYLDEVLVSMLERHSGKTRKALPLRTLRIIKRYERLTIEGWTISDIPKLNLGSKSHRMTPTLSFSVHTMANRVESLHCSVLRALHIQHVSFLGFALVDDVHEEQHEILNWLETVQNLQFVTLQDTAFHVFCARLGAEQTGIRDGGILFPKLEQVTFEQRASEPGIQQGKQILDNLKRRNASQAPLRRLRLNLKDDHRTRQWVGELGEIVPFKVTWRDP